MEKKLNVFLIFLLSVFILSAGISLSGCGGTAGTSGQSSVSSSGAVTVTGTVKGGFTSITPTSVAVYGCTAMDFSNCTQVATTAPTSGSFNITYNPVSTDTSYFVEATVGDVELEAVVPPNIPSGGITVNEYTTMLTQEAYYYAQKTNAANAGLTVANILSLEDPSYDGMPNTTPASNTSLQAIEPYLVVMADDIAACIDASSSPYTSLAATSACTTLESDVNTGIGTATSVPTTVQGILSNIASTLTTYYGNSSNSTDQTALLTMQSALNTLVPAPADFTYAMPISFAPSTVEQLSIGKQVAVTGTITGSTGTGGTSSASNAGGLDIMSSAGCLGCHTITVSGTTYGPGAPYNNPASPYYIAPDLSDIGNYLSSTGINIAVNTMDTQLSGALISPLNSSQLSTIVTYLGTLTSGGTPTITATNGNTIMTSAGCLGCHTINGQAAQGFSIAGGVGPDLSTLGSTINPTGISLGVNWMSSYVLASGLSSALTSADQTVIETYLGTLQGTANSPTYTNGTPLYEGASTTQTMTQETCLLCHSAFGYNGVTSTSGNISIGPVFNSIVSVSSGNASYMNTQYFENGLTNTQLDNVVNYINLNF